MHPGLFELFRLKTGLRDDSTQARGNPILNDKGILPVRPADSAPATEQTLLAHERLNTARSGHRRWSAFRLLGRRPDGFNWRAQSRERS
jgi:hypothetical protein